MFRSIGWTCCCPASGIVWSTTSTPPHGQCPARRWWTGSSGRRPRTPDAVALTWQPRQSLTYAELEARANQLAWHLRADGIGPEDRVALCFERSPELIVATLAVLKAGAAYRAARPWPSSERTAWLLADASPRRLLTSASLADRLPVSSIPTLYVDSPSALGELAVLPAARLVNADRTRPLRGAHPAYVIYTSGSTGTPKGVVDLSSEHRSLHRHGRVISSAPGRCACRSSRRRSST